MTASPICKIETARRFAMFALAITAFTLASALPDGAHAQNFGSFLLELCEKEMKLEHPVNMMWDKWLMWDTATQREAERNMPYFELTNNGASTAPLTQLHLTIGDSRFNFAPVEGGHFALRGGITTHTLTSSTIGGNELLVNIGNGGLAPGQSIRFKINLNVDASFAADYQAMLGQTLPDFRTILFDMNGKNIYDAGMPVDFDTADNAMAWSVFDPADGPNFETDPAPFADEIVPGGDIFAARQYGDMDPVLIFDLEGETPPEGVIPEPSGIALVVLATLCAVVVRSGPRRRTAAA